MAADGGALDHPAPAGGRADRGLPRRLDMMREEAEDWLKTPLRAHSEFQRGFLETVAQDSSGLLWVSGWMHRDQPLEFPAVILDRQKYPAAVALTCFPREDLPSDAQGVIGALRADWRPSGPDSDIFLFFGEEMRFFQRAVKPLRLMDPRDAIEQFERVRAHCTGPLTAALQRLVASPENWLPDSARAAGFPAHAAVDRLMMLPGFGCLAEGWAMSPVKRVERLVLKCGARILHSDPLATYHRPRHDLREPFPACGGSVTDRAGFVTVFRGRIEPEDFVDPMLKVVFTDGTSSNHAVPVPAMRQIGHSAAPEEALVLYPSLPHEAFFPEFAVALGREAASRIGGCEPWRVQRGAARAIVFALPRDRSDLYLAFEEARDIAAGLADPPGFVFLAERGRARPDVLSLFLGVAEAAGGRAPCSLFLLDDADYAFHHLDTVLEAVGARRFLFVAPGVDLTEEGWRKGLAALSRPPAASSLSGDDVPEVLDVLEVEAAEGARAEADAFVWSAAALQAVLPRLPVFAGGRHGDNGLQDAGVPVVRHPECGQRSDGGRHFAALTRQVNEAIAALHRAGAGADGLRHER